MEYLIIEKNDPLNSQVESILFNGINENAKKIKNLKPIISFCFSLEDDKKEIFGGINGFAYYGCLYIDMLWIDDKLRNKGFGSKLMHKAEEFGKLQNCTFATVNTMSFEALSFYLNLGYLIEFTRIGYSKDCKMYMLRKNFVS